MRELDPAALAEALSIWKARTRATVLRIGGASHASELAQLRAAIARLFGTDDRALELRLRRAGAGRPAAIEIELPLDGGNFRFELSTVAAVKRPCFRGASLSAQYAGTLPSGADPLIHRLGNRLARADRSDSRHPDVAFALEALRRDHHRAERETVPTEALFGPEAARVRALLAASERSLGIAPTIVRFAGAEPDVLSLNFGAELAAATTSFRLPPRIVADPSSAAYLHRLGFDWTAHGEVCTVPYPASLRRLLARDHNLDSGFTPSVVRRSGRFERRRLHDRTIAVLSIGLGSRWYYALGFPARAPRSERRRREAQLATLLRDLVDGVLACQLVPRSLLRTIGGRVRSELDRSWARRWNPPEALAAFYDVDLLAFASARWASVSGLDELPAALVTTDALAELCDRLAARTREARGSRRRALARDSPGALP